MALSCSGVMAVLTTLAWAAGTAGVSAGYTVQLKEALVPVAPEASVTVTVMPVNVFTVVPTTPAISPVLEMARPLGAVPPNA